MSTYHYSGPSVNHSLLSPSGRMSKRARKAAMAREAARLFPPGTFTSALPVQPTKAESLRRHAAMLRDLANRGMSVRSFTRNAERLEAEASKLEAVR